jgi:phosphoribosylaminoimidazolecarboxamide formyltransferase/IMP cyclohydrolase
MKMITNIIKNNKTINSVINKNLKNKAWKQVSDFYLSLSQRYNKYNSKYLKLEYRNKALHGENPNQKPCKIYSIKSNAVSAINSNRYDINKLCYTNIVDLDNLINIAILLSKTFKKVFNKIPYISLAAKHGNPCGASFSWSSKEETITNSLNTNSDAMLGGEFLCNFDLNKKLAEKIYYNKKDKRKLDMVFSTKYHENALNVFKQRKQTKIISNYNLNNIKNNKELFYRKINAGFLEQPNQEFILSKKNFKGNKFNHEKIQDIILAWCIVSNSFFGGNEVALVKNKKLLMCSGGPSTLEATKTLFFRLKNIGKKEISKGALFAADAFFPFTDCLKILLKNNCFDGIVPTGSINDNKVYEFCRQNKMNVVFLDKNIRGFCRH